MTKNKNKNNGQFLSKMFLLGRKKVQHRTVKVKVSFYPFITFKIKSITILILYIGPLVIFEIINVIN